ncbi:MAG: putative DNA binding domain-containing protein [Planctomycetes bacterium]|nr:putative DNA binding domain-containing protein [Planctomycetota bacterium]
MFDTKAELLEKIRLGEDSAFEMKAVHFRGTKIVGPGRDELADEIAAFANTHAGVLLLGVEDKTRRIEGIPADRLDAVEGLVREILHDSIEPPAHAIILRLELPDSDGNLRAVLKVEVPNSAFVHRSPGGYYMRSGSSKRLMAPDLLSRLFQERSRSRWIRFEESPVPGTTFADLSESLWRRFLGRSLEPPERILEKRGILVHDDAGVVRASVAGLLMASPSPEKFLPGALIEAVRYRGTARDGDRQLDAQTIRGPADEQIRQGMAFLRRNQSVAARKIPYRIETPQFSERVVFEALVNAVAHRDYSVHASKIRLFMFDDRLELYSPGGLVNSLTVESLPLRQATRNEILTRLLSECPVPDTIGHVQRTFYLEKRGEGVPIILEDSEALSGRRPEYLLIDAVELRLTIFSAKPPFPEEEPQGKGT